MLYVKWKLSIYIIFHITILIHFYYTMSKVRVFCTAYNNLACKMSLLVYAGMSRWKKHVCAVGNFSLVGCARTRSSKACVTPYVPVVVVVVVSG